jgi:hypothetical protein
MIDNLVNKLLIAGGIITLAANNLRADLTNLYNELTGKGIVATQNEKTTINGVRVEGDIFASEFDNANLAYSPVVIDEVSDPAESTAVVNFGGYYTVSDGASGEADRIYGEITSVGIKDFRPNGIDLEVRKKSNVSIYITDILGRKVSNVFNGVKGKGNYSLGLDMSNLPIGVYLCNVESNGRYLKPTRLVKTR